MAKAAKTPKSAKSASKRRNRAQTDLMRARRRGGRVVDIGNLTPEQHEWRTALETSDEDWLRWFFPDPPFGFWYEFTPQQKAMIEAIGHAIQHGGDQAIAASRGEGKTALARRLTIKYVLSGRIQFAVLFAATAADAGDSLQAIRADIEDNDRLAEYYPEVCDPVRGLEGVPQKASSMLASGVRYCTGEAFEEVSCRFTWCGHEITMPNVPGSVSAGAIIATRGLDSAVRGLNKKGRRPDVAIIDDPDTEDTSRSAEQAKKLENRIDRAIAGLGGQQRSISRVMLTTLQNRTCASYRYTDPIAKPTWKGKRFRFLLHPPDRADLWSEYVQLVARDLQSRNDAGECADPFCRGAHKFYLDHFADMNSGAVVANPHRFDPADLGDGSRLEESALQRYFNMVARLGPEAVATEYDNDPPEEEGPQESGISAHRIQCQVNGLDRKVVPAGCVKITQGIDCRKTALHWVVRAWTCRDNENVATGHTIDYGVTEVRGPVKGDEGLDEAIVRALRERRDQMTESPYMTEAEEVVPVDLTLIDSAWQQQAVYQFCREEPIHFKPAIGAGEGGVTQANFHPVLKATSTKRPGDGWFDSLQEGRKIWLVVIDSRDWKNFEHNRWMSDPEQPGSLLMWGCAPTQDDIRRGRLSRDQKAHFAYAKHLTAEVLVEEPNKDGVLVRKWKAKSDTNHWFDASYRADVAASKLGVELLGRRGLRSKSSSGRVARASLSEVASRYQGRPSLSDMTRR